MKTYQATSDIHMPMLYRFLNYFIIRPLFTAAMAIGLMAGMPSAYAAQASPDPAYFTRPDGTVARVYIEGDEFLEWIEYAGGNRINFDITWRGLTGSAGYNASCIDLRSYSVNTFVELRDAISCYSAATGDVVITVTEGFPVAADLNIPANANGKTLTIRGENPTITLTRGAAGGRRSGLFAVDGGAKLILEDIIVDGDRNVYSAGNAALVYVVGEFTMKAGAVLMNNIGGGVFIDSGGTFTMPGGKISGNTCGVNEFDGCDGGGAFVDNGGVFSMTGGEIVDNAAYFGGGVYISAAGIFNLGSGAVISENTAVRGAGVFVDNGGEFAMSGGKLVGNYGDCRVDGYGWFFMSFGGGVFVSSGGEFQMSDGEISDNTAEAGYGGGVFVDNGGAFAMTGGTISDNKAGSGGGVLVSGAFVMTGGKISNNAASLAGGGVYIDNGYDNNSGMWVGGEFTMTGGEISGNAITEAFFFDPSGGGVYVYAGEIILGGNAVIRGNQDGNVHLADGRYIKLSMDVPPVSGMNVGVRTETAGGVIVESGAKPGDQAYFIADESGKKAIYDTGGLRISDSYNICVGEICVTDDSADMLIPHDITLTSPVNIPAGTTLAIRSADAANPVTLTRGIAGDWHNGLFTVDIGAKLILENIIVDGNKDVYSGKNAALVYVVGEFTMKDGVVLMNNIGGGVYVDNGGAFTMTGGKISGNFSGIISDAYELGECVGGGVFIDNGAEFTMTGGEIADNAACFGGGVYISTSGIFNLGGGAVIRENTAIDGSGVYVDGVFSMTGGKIIGNYGACRIDGCRWIGMPLGGGVFVSQGGGFRMNDGEISENKAYAGAGGGVFIRNGGTFAMTDGKIRDNEADHGGGVLLIGAFTMTGGEISGNTIADDYFFATLSGGVHVNDGEIILGGNAVIRGNQGSNVHLAAGRYITLSLGAPPVSGMSVGVRTETAGGVIVGSGAKSGDETYFIADEPGGKVVYDTGRLRIIDAIINLLASIEVTAPPAKSVYVIGDALDLEGIVVTAAYGDGNTNTVSGYSTNPANGAVLNATGKQTVTVGYFEGSAQKTTSFTVTVNDIPDDNGEYSYEVDGVSYSSINNLLWIIPNSTPVAVKLLNNVDYPLIIDGKIITFDLNGNNLTGGIQAMSGSVVTLTDDVSGVVAVYGGGTVTIDGALKVEDNNCYVIIDGQCLGKQDGIPSTIKPGYIEYTINGASAVWVMAPVIIYGDVSGDKIVTPLDSTLLARWLAEWANVAINEEAADVNDDGKVTPLDRTILQRHLAGWAGYETLPFNPDI